jgi:hypothetical protein
MVLKQPQLMDVPLIKLMKMAMVKMIIRQPMMTVADRVRMPATRRIPQINSTQGRMTAIIFTDQ